MSTHVLQRVVAVAVREDMVLGKVGLATGATDTSFNMLRPDRSHVVKAKAILSAVDVRHGQVCRPYMLAELIELIVRVEINGIRPNLVRLLMEMSTLDLAKLLLLLRQNVCLQ